jgi:hypothetical protein
MRRAKRLYIELESKKGLQRKGQGGTYKIKVKKIVAIAEKRRDPNWNCKQFDTARNMDEK